MAKLSGRQYQSSPNITSFEKSYQWMHVYNNFNVTTTYGLKELLILREMLYCWQIDIIWHQKITQGVLWSSFKNIQSTIEITDEKKSQ